MLVPGIFLIGETFKSPELNTCSKLELLKTLLLFSRPLPPIVTDGRIARCSF